MTRVPDNRTNNMIHEYPPDSIHLIQGQVDRAKLEFNEKSRLAHAVQAEIKETKFNIGVYEIDYEFSTQGAQKSRSSIESIRTEMNSLTHAITKAEVRLKMLRKELDILQYNAVTAEALAAEAQKKFDEENISLNELEAKLCAASDARQSAYVHWKSLQKKLFSQYEDEALHLLCSDLVEELIQFWNTSDFDFDPQERVDRMMTKKSKQESELTIEEAEKKEKHRLEELAKAEVEAHKKKKEKARRKRLRKKEKLKAKKAAILDANDMIKICETAGESNNEIPQGPVTRTILSVVQEKKKAKEAKAAMVPRSYRQFLMWTGFISFLVYYVFFYGDVDLWTGKRRV